jgi:hypothetical protein
MIRPNPTSLLLAVLAAGTPLPSSAQQATSVLSLADQERVVCLPSRTRSGQLDGRQVCLTGRELEDQLTNRGAKKWVPPSDYLATPTAFRLNPFRR